MKRLVAALIFAGLAGACSSGRAFITLRGEYDAFKETRVAETLEGRVGAAHRYLRDYPEGAYAKDVRAYFKRAEPLFYKLSRRSIDGLRRYLAVLPDGPHHEEAASSLDAALIAAGRPDELSRSSAELARKASAAKASREAASDRFDRWLVAALDPALYRGALGDAPAAFLVPFRVSLPEPACRATAPAGRICEKPQQTTFIAPVSGESGLVEREWFYDVSVDLSEGEAITAVTLDGPSLFVRWHEATRATPEAEPESVPFEALDSAAERLTQAFEDEVGSLVGCARDVSPPVILSLACHGLALEAIAGLEGAPDKIVIRPQAP